MRETRDGDTCELFPSFMRAEGRRGHSVSCMAFTVVMHSSMFTPRLSMLSAPPSGSRSAQAVDQPRV